MAITAGGFVGGVGLGAVTSGIGSALTPELARIEQWSWRNNQVQLPDVNSLLAAWQRKFLTGEQAGFALSSLGVDWPFIASERHIYGGIEGWKNRTDRRAIWHGTQELLWNRPETADYIGAALRGFIQEDSLQYRLNRIGTRLSDWRLMFDMYRAWMPPTELIVLRNREVIDDDTFHYMLKAYGGYNGSAIAGYDELRKAYPGISDLTTMAVREAFSPAIAGPLGQYDERPDVIEKYFAAQGLGWKIGLEITDSKGNRRDADWLDMIWAMHWQAISPTQSYTMFHRLRPSQIGRYNAQGFNIKPFTLDDVKRHLRISDYPAGIREYLAAIAYNPLRLFDIRNAFLFGVEGANRDWVKERLLDRGLHPDDAETATKLVEETKKRREQLDPAQVAKQCARKWLKVIDDGIRLGTISVQEEQGELIKMGLDPGIIANCTAAARVDLANRLTKEILKAIRHEYLHGGLTDADVDRMLTNAGINEATRLLYRQGWAAQLTLTRKEASANQIVRWYRKGLLHRDVAILRLERLGYSGPDRALLLAEAEQEIAEALLKEQQSALKAEKAQAKEIERLQREIAAMKARNEARLRRLTPVSLLKKLVQEGQLSDDNFINRMEAMDYDRESSILWLESIGHSVTKTNGQASPP